MPNDYERKVSAEINHSESRNSKVGCITILITSVPGKSHNRCLP